MESQFDSGEGPVADLPADLIESNPAADDQLLDDLLVLAHLCGELLQRSEARLAVFLVILGAGPRAVCQAVEAVVELGARHLVLTSSHICSRLETTAS